jgi:hypothetical protein
MVVKIVPNDDGTFLRCTPDSEVQRLAHVLAAQRTLDPNWAVTPVPAAAFRFVRTIGGMTPVDSKRHGWESTTSLGQSRYKRKVSS